MTMIASEISYIKPFPIDSLYSVPGERYDFVVNANQPAKDYWIRVKTINPCRKQVEAFAILRYGDDYRMSVDTRVAFTSELPPKLSVEDFPTLKIFSPYSNSTSILDMEAYSSDRSIIDNAPDQSFFLFLDSPTILDETLNHYGNYYKLSCESIDIIVIVICFEIF